MSRQIPNQLMQLSYPQHVAEFPTYEDAQAAVDYLADKRFAVQNILIVGTSDAATDSIHDLDLSGPVAFVLGAEYREESSDARPAALLHAAADAFARHD